MLERLHFALLGGCVGEGTQVATALYSVALKHRESLEEEGALAVVICALCNAPSKVAQEVHAILVNGSHCLCRDWNKHYYYYHHHHHHHHHHD